MVKLTSGAALAKLRWDEWGMDDAVGVLLVLPFDHEGDKAMMDVARGPFKPAKIQHPWKGNVPGRKSIGAIIGVCAFAAPSPWKGPYSIWGLSVVSGGRAVYTDMFPGPIDWAEWMSPFTISFRITLTRAAGDSFWC